MVTAMEQTETWQKIEKRPGLCVVRACVCVPERETGGGETEERV